MRGQQHESRNELGEAARGRSDTLGGLLCNQSIINPRLREHACGIIVHPWGPS
jgi:hypothetical protein